MFTIFLVEDEYAVRERMKRSINWEENGFILIGEAGDGEIAYSKILENKPDIVITDIKMPFMVGLELSRLLRESMPQIKILILSGYDDFKYAKEAISIGVTDYLLKPITSKKLIEAIKKVSFIIEKERVEEKQLKKQLLSQEISHNQAKKSFYNELVTCRYTPIELINRAKELDIELVASSYNIILIKVFLEDATSSEYSVIHKSLNQKLDVWCKEHKKSIYLIEKKKDGLFFLKRL